MQLPYDLEKIFTNFALEVEFLSAKPYGSGHINDTFLLTTKGDGSCNYIFQRINQNVFKDVDGLMTNIARVTQHIRQKARQLKIDPDRATLTLVKTKNGNNYFFDEKNQTYWRAYAFITGTKTYDRVENPLLAYQGGRAFGQFQRYLADLPGGPLNVTIPNFHNIDHRFKQFKTALQADKLNRAKEVSAEISFVEAHINDMRLILQLGEAGKIPLRVTHNDTKFNNVLIDSNDKALCVVDLDTVMPGYVHYDYSDTIRTATNTAAEDEADLNKVSMDLELFAAFTKGFLEETKDTLNKAELEALPASVKLMPFMIGLRFLTDYLAGDTYFKIGFAHHNLNRARAQFKLTQSIMEQEQQIKSIIAELTTQEQVC